MLVKLESVALDTGRRQHNGSKNGTFYKLAWTVSKLHRGSFCLMVQRFLAPLSLSSESATINFTDIQTYNQTTCCGIEGRIH